MAEFKMPMLGADMTAGTLIGWLKNVGDTVERGDIIAEVDTDKGVIEVEVFTDGVIEKFLVKAGEKVPVGTTLAIIKENGKAGGIIGPAKPPPESRALPPPAPALDSQNGKTAETIRIHASPVARKLAEQLGIDLAEIKGSGPNGRIQREDVELAAKASGELKKERVSPKTETDEPDRYARMRRAIAAAMARSKREIPHYYLATSIDMSRSLAWLEKENAKYPVKDRILYSVLLIKAVALALRETPELNAVWENERLDLKPEINIGVAISLRRGGLISPALFEVDRQTLAGLMKNFRELVGRTRAGTLRSSELSDSTVTLTNLGETGVETVFGVIYPPQVALVGFGKIYESVSVSDGRIKGCFKINATLAADHRASDGHRGSKFLSAVERFLQEPEKL